MKKIIFLIFCLFILSSCYKQELNISLPEKANLIDNSKEEEIINNEKYFAVIAHHNLVNNSIDDFYSELKNKYSKFDNIVIISPNHFSDNSFTIKNDRKICYKNSGKVCLDFNKIELDGFNNIDNNFQEKEGYLETHEHGIGNHFSFIKKYFLDSKLYFLLLNISINNNEKVEKISKELNNYNFKGKTLFIFSVDFSHHVQEKVAVFHDLKTIDFLNGGEKDNIEVDCPNCLYLAKSLANKNKKNYFNIYNRTSTDSKLNINSNYDNTSHIYGLFEDEKNTLNMQKSFSGKFLESNFGSGKINDNYIYGISFGDTHFTRGFTYFTENNKKNIGEYFKCFNSNGNIDKKPEFWHNRMLYSFDFVGLNLETSVGNKDECQKSEKEIVFQTNPKYLDIFKKYGFNIFNLANNHSYDCGEIGYDSTKKHLKENKLNYFGDGRREESVIYKTEINGIKIAYVGFNDIGKQINIDNKSEKIKSLTNAGYIVIVNIHWGYEYVLKHNKRQEKIAKSFIDSGAKLIIGHHPHVVQDVEIYNGVPIIYSLGNFIFDQPFEETLKGYGLIYAINQNSIKYNMLEFTRDKNYYNIDCNSFK